ncbi:MAG TPA: dATP/dGTP diphosphohydrolase domain-containing protein [Acidobacteriaceae bacterium]|nr:dATP/dGTP diphosphohydrolase domain-containing protein [Acidobacteriaceae bacterium]
MKPSNPKDIVGSTKIDLGLVPDSLIAYISNAFLEGALKYGRYNWRVAGVRASIYHAALKRHLAKWWNGQDRDPQTRVHHLANALACIAIILDAEVYGKLNDDRPPVPDPDAMARLIDGQTVNVAFLKALFKSHNPHQYTIHDTRRPSKRRRQGAPQRARRVQAHARSKRHGRARS